MFRVNPDIITVNEPIYKCKYNIFFCCTVRALLSFATIGTYKKNMNK